MSLLRSQPITEKDKKDRAKRERLANDAIASMRLEGLEPSPPAIAIWQRYVEGEISVERAGELIRALPTGA